MTEQTPAAGLSIKVVEYERDFQEVGEWLNIDAVAKGQRFGGATDFWTSRRELMAFLDDLEIFAGTLSDPPTLAAGSGEYVLFQVSFAVADRLGHLVARVEVANRHPPPEDRLSVEFGSEPQLLIDFAVDLRRTIEQRSSTRVLLPSRELILGSRTGKHAQLWARVTRRAEDR